MMQPSPCGDPKCLNTDSIIDGDGVKCFGCNAIYHFDCAGVAESTHRKKGAKAKVAWRCEQKCRNDRRDNPKKINEEDNTDDDTEFDAASQNLAIASIKDPDLKIIFSFLTKKMNQLEKSTKFISDKYDELLKKNKELDEKLSQVSKEKDEEIRALKIRSNEANQYERKNNIEIFGLEIKDNENVYNLAAKTINMFDQSVDTTDIDYAHRLPSRNKNRPPSILVVLKSRKKKMDLLEKVKREKKKIPQKEIIAAASKPYEFISVSENLSGYYKNLLWSVKQKALEKNYKYVWYKNCRIFVRKTDGDKNIVIIRDEQDIYSLT